MTGDIDPTFVLTHQMELGRAPEGYETFKKKQDDCMKVVLKPEGAAGPHLRIVLPQTGIRAQIVASGAVPL